MKLENAKIKIDSISKQKDLQKNKRVSIYTESHKGEYYNIDVKKLIPFKKQSRKTFDKTELEELAKTIKNYGIRQPLTILPSEEEGKYEIISGERRWRAAQIIGLNKVPCIILQNKNTAEEIALIENVQRKDLHPIELMEGIKNLLNKKVCKSQQEIAEKIGISRTIVVETLALQKLPVFIQQKLLVNKIKSRELLRKLLKSSEKEQEIIVNNFIKKIKNTKLKQNKKNKVFSIYIDSNELIFDKFKEHRLELKHRDEIKKYLQNLIETI